MVATHINFKAFRLFACSSRYVVRISVVFLTIFFTSVTTADTGKRLACITGNDSDAIKACEEFVAEGNEDYFIYLKLARYYKMKNRLVDAQAIYEKAISAYNDSSLFKEDAANLKSDMEEQEWLEDNPLSVDEKAILRTRCINLSDVLPEDALPACKKILKYSPEDAEVIEHKKIAQQKLNNTETEIVAENEAVRLRGVDENIESAENQTQVVDAPVANDDSIEPPKELAQPIEVASIDPDISIIINDMRDELKQLYKTIDDNNKNNSRQIQYTEKGDRYALVIGNSSYQGGTPSLKNPVNDANDISNALKNLDFDVNLVTNATRKKMERAINDLSTKMNVNDVVLFYYAGHGVAIDGKNYLLPANTPIEDDVDVVHKSFTASYVLDKLKRIGDGMTLVILDACRNNPFAVAKRGAKVIDGGLVNVTGYGGSLIAYATAPERVAIDGDGRNGVYTKHLIQNLNKPNLKLEDMFKRVRVAVQDETEGKQIPWENSSLVSDFYFNLEK